VSPHSPTTPIFYFLCSYHPIHWPTTWYFLCLTVPFRYVLCSTMSLLQEWCKAHPTVGPVSIRGLTSDGCLVVPLDGNESNAAPSNLILIHGSDSKTLRGFLGKPATVVVQAFESPAPHIGPGEHSYALRKANMAWANIALRVYPGKPNARIMALNRAKEYARSNSLPWPIKRPPVSA